MAKGLDYSSPFTCSLALHHANEPYGALRTLRHSEEGFCSHGAIHSHGFTLLTRTSKLSPMHWHLFFRDSLCRVLQLCYSVNLSGAVSVCASRRWRGQCLTLSSSHSSLTILLHGRGREALHLSVITVKAEPEDPFLCTSILPPLIAWLCNTAVGYRALHFKIHPGKFVIE